MGEDVGHFGVKHAHSFCSEPRVLSKEVWELRHEVAAMHEVVLLPAKKLDAAPSGSHNRLSEGADLSGPALRVPG
jgi:hypothetical protein